MGLVTGVILRPYQDTKGAMTPFGGPVTEWQALNKETPYEGGAGKPSTASGVASSGSAEQLAQVRMGAEGAAFGLPLGTKLIAGTLRVYGEAEAAGSLVLAVNSIVTGTVTVKTNGATMALGWQSWVLSRRELEESNGYNNGERVSAAATTMTASSTAVARIYQVHLELEYEQLPYTHGLLPVVR